MTIEDRKQMFISRGESKFGDKFDYSKVDYINNRTKVDIICPIHGEFRTTPENHLLKHGCPKCANKKNFEISPKKIIPKIGDIVGCNTITKIIKKDGIEDEYELICNRCGSKRIHTRVQVIYMIREFKTKVSTGCKFCYAANRSTSKQVNHDAFDNLNDPETLYWIGMLYADGNIETESRNRVILGLIDEEHMLKFKTFLCSTHKLLTSIRYDGGKPLYTLSITSKNIVSKLKSLGFTENKSLTIVPHDLLKNEPAFWAGVFDGDGSISTGDKNKPYRLRIYGNYETCKAFSKFCLDRNIKTSVDLDKRNTYVVTTSVIEDVIKIYDVMFSNIKEQSLLRKRLRCEKMKRRNENIKSNGIYSE